MADQIEWLDEPAPEDYDHAMRFLSLLMPRPNAASIVNALRVAKNDTYNAKDIVRAARLKLLKKSNPYVANQLDKVNDGQALSPILLVRGDAFSGVHLLVADGYHRVNASYHIDEDAPIPCRLVPLEKLQ